MKNRLKSIPFIVVIALLVVGLGWLRSKTSLQIEFPLPDMSKTVSPFIKVGRYITYQIKVFNKTGEIEIANLTARSTMNCTITNVTINTVALEFTATSPFGNGTGTTNINVTQIASLTGPPLIIAQNLAVGDAVYCLWNGSTFEQVYAVTESLTKTVLGKVRVVNIVELSEKYPRLEYDKLTGIKIFENGTSSELSVITELLATDVFEEDEILDQGTGTGLLEIRAYDLGGTPVDAQGVIVETNQRFEIDCYHGVLLVVPAGSYTVQVTYDSETKTRQAEVFDGQTTYLRFEFGSQQSDWVFWIGLPIVVTMLLILYWRQKRRSKI